MKRTESVEIYAYQSNFSALGPSEQVVVLGSGTLSFVYLYKHTGLVVRVSGEIFGSFGGNGGVTLKSSQDNSSTFDTVEKRATSRRTWLFFIGHALVGLLTIKEVEDEFDDMRNTRGTKTIS